MRRLVAVLLLALAVTAGAITPVNTSTGTTQECTAACSTGASAVTMQGNGGAALIFLYTGSGTTSLKIQNSIDGGTTWVDVTGASCTSCTSGTAWAIAPPLGVYRSNVTTCTACTYKIQWMWGKYL